MKPKNMLKAYGWMKALEEKTRDEAYKFGVAVGKQIAESEKSRVRSQGYDAGYKLGYEKGYEHGESVWRQEQEEEIEQ